MLRIKITANMIDVHLLNNPRWAEKTQAIENILYSNELVTLYKSDPIDGDVFAARDIAFALGVNKYVSFVDADDKILDSSIFEKAITYLNENPDTSSVFSRWVSLHGKKYFVTPKLNWEPNMHDNWKSPIVHQIIVHRRENIIKTYDQLRGIKWGILESWIVNAAQMQFGKLHQIDCIAYEWLIHNGGSRLNPKMQIGEDILHLAHLKLIEFKKAYQLNPPAIQI